MNGGIEIGRCKAQNQSQRLRITESVPGPGAPPSAAAWQCVFRFPEGEVTSSREGASSPPPSLWALSCPPGTSPVPWPALPTLLGAPHGLLQPAPSRPPPWALCPMLGSFLHMLPKPVIPDFAKAPGLPIVAVTARTMYLAFSFRKQASGESLGVLTFQNVKLKLCQMGLKVHKHTDRIFSFRSYEQKDRYPRRT